MNGILTLLSSTNYVIVNKNIARAYGIETAIMLGELASEFNYYSEHNMLINEEWFFSTEENIEQNTTLNYYYQSKALAKLKELGIIEIKRKGIPAKRYIKINSEQVLNLFNSQFLNECKTRVSPISNLINNNNKINNNINKEINKEIKNDNKKYFDNDELNDRFKEFLDLRKKLKSVNTDRAITLLINKLEPYDDDTKLKMIDQSIVNSWKGIFPLKKEKTNEILEGMSFRDYLDLLDGKKD